MAIRYVKNDNAPERKESTVARKAVSDIESVPETPVDTPNRVFKTRKPNGTFDRKEYNKIYQRAYRKHMRDMAKKGE